MEDMLSREITRIARERRGARPSGLHTTLARRDTDDGGTDVLRLTHFHLDGTAYSEHGIPDALDGARLSAHATRMVQDAIDDIVRRESRAGAFERMRPTMEGSGTPHPWTDFTYPPSWALISHPVMVHALMRSGVNDLSAQVLRGDGEPAPGVTLRVVQDLLVGSCPLDPGDVTKGRVHCDDMGMVMEIGQTLPHVARTAILGHPLGMLVELPTCGDPALDAEIETLMVVDISDTVWNDAPGILVTLSPAVWCGCAPLPPRVNERALRLPNKIC